jgi:hypothetical protein
MSIENKNENSYSISNSTLYESAMNKKNDNVREAEAGSVREARTIAYIRKHSSLPLVAFNQGFAAGKSEVVSGLPSDAGIEPALSDIRLERVHQNHPSHVHIEVTGTSYAVKSTDHIYVKAEKLRQQLRSGDDKLIMCVFDKYSEQGKAPAPKAIMLHVPLAELKTGGKLDISGTAKQLSERFPPHGAGIQSKYVKGQLMICLPADSEFKQTREQFINHIERALNTEHFSRLTPEQKEADRVFHDKLQADKATLDRLNDGYLKERAQLTLKDGVVSTLGGLEQQKLKKIGSLNKPEIIYNYKKAVKTPNLAKSHDIER